MSMGTKKGPRVLARVREQVMAGDLTVDQIASRNEVSRSYVITVRREWKLIERIRGGNPDPTIMRILALRASGMRKSDIEKRVGSTQTIVSIACEALDWMASIGMSLPMTNDERKAYLADTSTVEKTPQLVAPSDSIGSLRERTRAAKTELQRDLDRCAGSARVRQLAHPPTLHTLQRMNDLREIIDDRENRLERLRKIEDVIAKLTRERSIQLSRVDETHEAERDLMAMADQSLVRLYRSLDPDDANAKALRRKIIDSTIAEAVERRIEVHKGPAPVFDPEKFKPSRKPKLEPLGASATLKVDAPAIEAATIQPPKEIDQLIIGPDAKAPEMVAVTFHMPVGPKPIEPPKPLQRQDLRRKLREVRKKEARNRFILALKGGGK